jgi:cellulose synthase/poly-beta-1,6-N-acetylglucosamine synthase-like glycosyltransferase
MNCDASKGRVLSYCAARDDKIPSPRQLEFEHCKGLSPVATELVFWACVLLVIYVYAGYPLVLVILSRFSRAREEPPSTVLPNVTLIVSAFNEQDCIAAKLDNTLALDYPRDRLEVIVVSDASDDGTDDIARGYSMQGVRLVRMPDRGGKTLGLNAGVAAASGEVIVFSDANALYRPDAIRRLVAPFASPEIGAVIGESTYVEANTESGRSESLYWRYETWIKALESRGGSVVGGDGAIYSVRRSLYKPMVAGALSDFVNPLQVVKAGYRCIYEPRALSYEEAAEDFGREYRRKVRIVNRAWRALWSMREMLNPLARGGFAWKLWSHKVLRWCVPGFLLAIFLLNLALIGRHPFYWLVLAAQIVFYALAVGGFLLRDRDHQPVALRIPFYFCVVNVAAGVGLFQVLGGRSYTVWQTSRAQT